MAFEVFWIAGQVAEFLFFEDLLDGPVSLLIALLGGLHQIVPNWWEDLPQGRSGWLIRIHVIF